jgi:murein DD-endopeptidase MepM/ murein hydrolase activator NlpD
MCVELELRMHKFVSFGPLGHVKIRSVLVAATALLMAGCSNSIERFQSAYNNPSDADPVYTASVPKARKITYRKPAVEQQDYAQDDSITESPVRKVRVPMAPVANINAQKPYDYSAGYKPAYKQARLVPPPAKTYSKPRLITPSEEQQDAMVDTAPSQPVYRAKPKAALVEPSEDSIAAGKTVQVGPGMSLASIARRNGVSVPDLIAANNLQAPFTVRQGQVLLVPEGQVAAAKPRLVQPAEQVADTLVAPKATTKKSKFNQTAAADDTTTEEPVVMKPTRKSSAGASYTVASGDTLYSVGRKFGVSPFMIADANGFAHDSALPLGQEIRVPGAKSMVAPVTIAEDTSPAPTTKKKAKLSLVEEEQTQAGATSEPAIGEDQTQQATAKPVVKIKEPVVAAAPTSTAMNLRWPLKGKIISGYGPKPDGMKNEGINIAVPEGTSIRAADDGVVAYAGNELKGYGNLVLVRHAGGFVTAYAHAKQLMVKRGDTVKRGDVIGLAGQTGAVTSPQLHFEVRKGAAALDPMKYISTSTASN